MCNVFCVLCLFYGGSDGKKNWSRASVRASVRACERACVRARSFCVLCNLFLCNLFLCGVLFVVLCSRLVGCG